MLKLLELQKTNSTFRKINEENLIQVNSTNLSLL